MILLLDASKIRIWDWDNDKLIFPQSENDFQAGYAEEINTLRDQYDFNQIKKIILIDTNPEPILSSVFRTAGYKGQYFESLFQEKSGYFYSLFRNTKVFNNSNLELTKSSDEKSYIFNFTDINSLNLKHLKPLIGDDKIIFFSNFLTPITIKILQHFKNIEGYYKPSISELKYEKILHTDEFLNLIFDLQRLKRIDYSTYKNKMAFSNINGVLPDYGNWTHIPQSLLNLKNFDQEKIKRILIVGSEKYLIREVVSIIWGDKKNIISFPSSAKISIGHECDGIIIKDIDALLNEDGTLTDDFTQLSLKLSQTELKEKIVVLHSTKSIPGIDLPGFTRILLPDKNEDENYYPDYFYYMLKQKQILNEKSTSHQENAARWLINSRSKVISSLLKKIPSLDDMDLLLDEIKIDPKLSVDFDSQDFWYEFVQYYKLKKVKLDLSQIKQEKEVFSIEKDEENNKLIELTFIYDVNTNKDKWIVTTNLSDDPHEIEYNKSLGIKIMAYLKEYPSCKKLDAIELREKIKDYYGKEYKPQMKKKDGISDLHKNAYNAMRGAVKYDLEKLFDQNEDKDQLVKRILKRFKFSERCYYTDKEDVNVFLTFNDPTLKNYPPAK